ncbi:hypothetical protein ABPG74_014755 [Tetrahymena malaccensis]
MKDKQMSQLQNLNLQQSQIKQLHHPGHKQNSQSINAIPTYKQTLQEKIYNKVLDNINFDDVNLNGKQKLRNNFLQAQTAKQIQQKQINFNSTKNMSNNLDKINLLASKIENSQKGTQKKIIKNQTLLGLSFQTNEQDQDLSKFNSQNADHLSKVNQSNTFLNDQSENYRVQFNRDQFRQQSGLRSPNHDQNNRKFTLSMLNKDKKIEGKKVFYCLKNAIKQDSIKQLQQLTIFQQAIISDDLKQNFIPKMLNVQHLSPNRYRHNEELSGIHSATSALNKQIKTDEISGDHQSKLLANMKLRNQKRVTSNNFSNERNAMSVISSSSKNHFKDQSIHMQQSSNQSSQIIGQNKQPSMHMERNQANRISSQFKKMAFIYQNDVHAQNNGIDQKLLMIIKILDSRTKIIKDLKAFNLDNTILQLMDIMKFSIEYDDLDLMMEVIMAMGDVYVMFGDLQSALNAFNTVRVLSDFTLNLKKKIECHLHLSQVSKKLKLYQYALKFMKKALQYVWEIKDVDTEIHIYEEIGLIFFHLSNLEKAAQFHQRAINGGVEYINSNQRQQASKNLHFYLQNLENKIESIDKYITLKIPMLPFQFVPIEENEAIPQHIVNNYMKKNKVKLIFDAKGFKSEMSEQYQFEQIFASDEFYIEIQTPRNDSQLNRFANNEGEIILQDSDEKDTDYLVKSSIRFGHNRSESQKFIPPKHLMKKQDYNTTFYLNESLKKKSLEEKIKDRVEELKLWEKRDHLGKLMSNPFIKSGHSKINQIVQINHLGVNRNVDNFDNSQNIQISKSNMFFNKIISQQYTKNTKTSQ